MLSSPTLDANYRGVNEISYADRMGYKARVECVASEPPPQAKITYDEQLFARFIDVLALSTFKNKDFDYESLHVDTSCFVVNALWQDTQNQIKAFEYLPNDWDGYGSEHLSKDTIAAALNVVQYCKAHAAEPSWVTCTSDETVLLMVMLRDGGRVKFEIETPDDIGVAKWDKNGRVSFHDATVNALNCIIGC